MFFLEDKSWLLEQQKETAGALKEKYQLSQTPSCPHHGLTFMKGTTCYAPVGANRKSFCMLRITVKD